MIKHFVFSLLLLTGRPLYLLAQQKPKDREELETDRPTRGQGPTAVPQGTMQIETGYKFQQEETPLTHQKEYVYPTTLLRIGILKKMELRVNADYKKEKTRDLTGMSGGTTAIEQGFSDVQVGAKVTLYRGSGAIPRVGMLGNVTLPVGNEANRPPHAAPEGSLLFSNKLSDKLELQYNAGYRKQKDQEEYRGEAIYAVSGNLKVTDKLTWFAEIFGQKPNHDKAAHAGDTGFMFKLLPDLQLDVIGSVGLNNEAPDYYAGGGVTWRIPR
jgi:hypothetical protein